MEDLIDWFQKILDEDLSGGDWQHGKGITLQTLDNPGWIFTFSLEETVFKDIPFAGVNYQKNDTDCYSCRIRNMMFEGVGGPQNLRDILEIFREWYIKACEIVDKEEKPK